MLAFNDFISTAHANFLKAVSSLVNRDVNPLYGKCSVEPCPGSATLKYEGVDCSAFKRLVVKLRIVARDEFTVVVEVSGIHETSDIFRTVDYRVESLFPENLANIVLGYYRGHATTTAA